jgi:F-type H+-transporting ATPase subunit c
MHLAYAAIGAAIAIGLIGFKATEATGRNPGAAGPIRPLSIILAALCEGIFILTLFVAGK